MSTSWLTLVRSPTMTIALPACRLLGPPAVFTAARGGHTFVPSGR
ncbi:hypothetical protein QDT91_24545 [Mycolicibacterium aubagnense]|nr:hypothetical protein [Mycolicibacterium aubagnense]WGI32312.1 hypothetical protein QDT91_24545 [Mycolicibacterium aubagnense]